MRRLSLALYVLYKDSIHLPFAALLPQISATRLIIAAAIRPLNLTKQRISRCCGARLARASRLVSYVGVIAAASPSFALGRRQICRSRSADAKTAAVNLIQRGS